MVLQGATAACPGLVGGELIRRVHRPRPRAAQKLGHQRVSSELMIGNDRCATAGTFLLDGKRGADALIAEAMAAL